MKKILFTLCFAAALTGASGQIYIDSYRFGAAPAAADLLLDSFPNAAVAYSLRQLDKDYTGSCITVRRNNGDTSNIAFLSNYLDTAALKTFCGTGATDTCWVRRVFDQSGNANNAGSTTNANQPRILTSGVLEKDGSNATMVFDGINDRLVIDSAVLFEGNAFSLFFAFRNTNQIINTSVTGAFLTGISTDENAYFTIAFGGNWTGALTDERISIIAVQGGTVRGYGQTTENITASNNLYSFIFPNAAPSLYRNDALKTLTDSSNGGWTSTTEPTSAKGIMHNHFNSASFINGKVQEIIIYKSDQTSNRSAINGNINRAYSIY
jgi:hypothetical protein